MLISIPLYIFLFIYLAFIALFITFFVFNLIHLMHTGGTTMVSLTVTVLVLAAAAFTLFFTWAAVNNVDWKQTVDIHIANTFATNY